jgi:hypothetical protein
MSFRYAVRFCIQEDNGHIRTESLLVADDATLQEVKDIYEACHSQPECEPIVATHVIPLES